MYAFFKRQCAEEVLYQFSYGTQSKIHLISTVLIFNNTKAIIYKILNSNHNSEESTR